MKCEGAAESVITAASSPCSLLITYYSDHLLSFGGFRRHSTQLLRTIFPECLF